MRTKNYNTEYQTSQTKGGGGAESPVGLETPGKLNW